AMQRLNATLAEDPDNPDVTQLLESIRQEIELRARKNRQRDGISKGRGLILTQLYDQAIAVLEALDREQPGIEQVGELLVLAKAKRAEKERRSQVRQGLESARELAAARRFDEALECLDRLEQQFPGENEIAAVLANVQREAEEFRRAEIVEEATRALQELAPQGKFEEALDLLRQALKRCPGDDRLIRLLQLTSTAERDAQLEAARQKTLEQVKTLVAGGRAAEAVHLAESFTSAYGGDPAMDEALGRAREAALREERERTIQKVLSESEQRLREGHFDSALVCLDRALAEYADERLRSAREEVARRHADQQEQESMLSLSQEAEQLLAEGKPQHAVEVLRRGLERHPNQTLLDDLLQRAQECQRRDEAVVAAIAQCDALFESGQSAEALQRIRVACQVHAEDVRLAAARDRLQAAWEQQRKRDAARRAISECRALLDGNRPVAAVDAIQKALAQFPLDRALAELLAEAQRAAEKASQREFIQEHLDLAEQHRQKSDLDTALRVLEEAAARCGEAGTLATQIRELRSQIAAEKTQRLQQALELHCAEIAECLGRGDMELAIMMLSEALRLYPGEVRLLQFERQVAVETDFRHKIEMAHALAGSGQYSAAEKIAHALLALRPQDAAALGVLQAVAQRRRQDEEQQRDCEAGLRRVEQLVEAADFDGALAELERLEELYPAHTGLRGSRQAALLAQRLYGFEVRLVELWQQFQAGSNPEELRNALAESSRMFSEREIQQRPSLLEAIRLARTACRQSQFAGLQNPADLAAEREAAEFAAYRKKRERFLWALAVALVLVVVIAFIVRMFEPALIPITASQSTIRIPHQLGQPDPPARTIALRSGDQPRGFRVSADSAWLRVSHPSGLTPQDIRIEVVTASLEAGEYTGRITIEGTPARAPERPETVEVILTVVPKESDRPPAALRLQANPSSLAFQAEFGSAPPAAQRVSVRPAGFAFRTSTPWLSVEREPGRDAILVSVRSETMASGKHSGAIEISVAATNSLLRIPVQVEVAAPPR
ncbi:MAG: hypothetical protein ACRD88_04810, partial [Terriglobia bacterium]